MSRGIAMAAQPEKVFFCGFDATDPGFDITKIADCLSALDVKMWNYIPGIFILVSDISAASLSSRLSGQIDCFQLLAEIDPATIEGFAPEQAWSALYFETLGYKLKEISEKRGWDVDGILKSQQEHLAN